jgi:metal-responsive CopG/Arc/MetJ family transcriptional regulator
MKRPTRRSHTKGKFRTIIVYFPAELVPLLDAAVIKSKSNRSKFIRQAIREKLVVKKI